jgi:hypothetical protein
VTISGVRFTDATSVTFNGAPAVFTVDSDIQITRRCLGARPGRSRYHAGRQRCLPRTSR